MKRIIALFMVISLIFPSCISIAETAKGKTIRLETYTGEVIVKSGTDKEVNVSDKMRIFDGYKVKTGMSSYIYLSLDDTKVIKLDQNTEISVKKGWFSNKIIVLSGTIFFNVTKPLESNEKLDLVTSTMSMGIRGTAGTLAINNGISIGQLYTGKVKVTGKKKIVNVNSGEQVISQDIGEGENKIEVTKLKADGSGIPSVALYEINNNSNLKDEIDSQTDLDTNNFGEQEKLNRMKEEEEFKKKEEEQLLKEQEANKNRVENKKSSTDNTSITGKSTGGGNRRSSTADLTWEELLNWIAANSNSDVPDLEEADAINIIDVTDYMQDFRTGLDVDNYSNISTVVKENVLLEEIIREIYSKYEIIDSTNGWTYDLVASMGDMENFINVVNERIELIADNIGCYMMYEEEFEYIAEFSEEVPEGAFILYYWDDIEITQDMDLTEHYLYLCNANITINDGATLTLTDAYVEASGNTRIYNNGTINAFNDGVTVQLYNPITAYRFFQGNCNGGLTVWLNDNMVWCYTNEDGTIEAVSID